MGQLLRPRSVTRPLPSTGRPLTRLKGSPRASVAPRSFVRQGPKAFLQNSTNIKMPDIPPGVVLDGNVVHLKSPKATVERKYREESR